ncbi:uncharacterized protein LOC131605567 [Vicia villosa]|uniref:uncharacterized protein LOC131605567 n=1 Tax=Vicia villosa TaxID=3911 RepID=UPI00273CA5CB|nr:uncharacterized protein LOC131605567 [Vicia villosa]
MEIKVNGSWIIKHILKLGEDIKGTQQWQYLNQGAKFQTRDIYKELMKHHPLVEWRGLVYKNKARPRAVFVLWLACQHRLATKDRLAKFGVNVDQHCVFCGCIETVQHLFFDCMYTSKVWGEVLGWLCIQHSIQEWNKELQWLIKICKSRNWRKHFVKIAVAETVYAVWMDRNARVFRNEMQDKNIVNSIIERITNRIWVYPKYRDRLAHLLLA